MKEPQEIWLKGVKMNKNAMKYVYLFTGSLLFYTIVMPILDSVSTLIQSAINKKIGNMQMELEQEQCEHQAACELIKPTERQPTNAIGFEIPNKEDEYYDDE